MRPPGSQSPCILSLAVAGDKRTRSGITPMMEIRFSSVRFGSIVVDGDTPEHGPIIGSVRHQAAVVNIFPLAVHRRHPRLSRQLDDGRPMAGSDWLPHHDEPLRTLLFGNVECRGDIVGRAYI